MRYYYGEQNILRALDEAEFLKHQEAEHTALIPLVTPNLERNYVEKLEQFGIDFGKMMAEVVRYIESATRSRGNINRKIKLEMLNLIKQCVDQSQEFTELLDDMVQNSHAVRANMPSQTVIFHMIRESKYFIGIDSLIISL